MGLRSAFTKEKASDKCFAEDCKILYDNTALDRSKKRVTDVYKYTDADFKQLWENDPGYISENAMKKLPGKDGGKNALKKCSDYIKEGYHSDMVNYSRADARGTKKTRVISEGAVLKRYGSEYGKFLADSGTPFKELQLPYSEDKYKGRLSYYKVAKPFKVTESTIAKQFTSGKEGQPVDSNSKQYKLKGFNNVNDLVKKGYLIRLDENSGGMAMKNKFEAKESKIDNTEKGEKNLGSNKPGFDKHCGSVVDKFKSKFSPANKAEKNTKNQEAKGENKAETKGENKGEKPKESFKERFMDKIKNRKMEKKADSREGDKKKDNEGESKVVNQILERPSEKPKANTEINKNTVEKKTENKVDNKKEGQKSSDAGNDGNDGNAAEANVDKGRERVREPGRSGGETTEDKSKQEAKQKEAKQKEADEKKKKAEAEAGNQEQNQRLNAFQQLLDNYKKKQEAKKEQKKEASEDKEDSEKEKTEKEKSKDSSETKESFEKQEDPRKAFADYLKSFSSPEANKVSKENEKRIENSNNEQGNDVKNKERGDKTHDDER